MDKKIILILLFLLYGCSNIKEANCEYSYGVYETKLNIKAINNHITDMNVTNFIDLNIFNNDKPGLEYYLKLYKEKFENVYLEDGHMIINENYEMNDSDDIQKISTYIIKDDEYFAFNHTIKSLIEDGYICVENMLK